MHLSITTSYLNNVIENNKNENEKSTGQGASQQYCKKKINQIEFI
jgi:hypothetical protein